MPPHTFFLLHLVHVTPPTPCPTSHPPPHPFPTPPHPHRYILLQAILRISGLRRMSITLVSGCLSVLVYWAHISHVSPLPRCLFLYDLPRCCTLPSDASRGGWRNEQCSDTRAPNRLRTRWTQLAHALRIAFSCCLLPHDAFTDTCHTRIAVRGQTFIRHALYLLAWWLGSPHHHTFTYTAHYPAYTCTPHPHLAPPLPIPQRGLFFAFSHLQLPASSPPPAVRLTPPRTIPPPPSVLIYPGAMPWTPVTPPPLVLPSPYYYHMTHAPTLHTHMAFYFVCSLPWFLHTHTHPLFRRWPWSHSAVLSWDHSCPHHTSWWTL